MDTAADPVDEDAVADARSDAEDSSDDVEVDEDLAEADTDARERSLAGLMG
jgi:hypothetical protein